MYQKYSGRSELHSVQYFKYLHTIASLYIYRCVYVVGHKQQKMDDNNFANDSVSH